MGSSIRSTNIDQKNICTWYDIEWLWWIKWCKIIIYDHFHRSSLESLRFNVKESYTLLSTINHVVDLKEWQVASFTVTTLGAFQRYSNEILIQLKLKTTLWLVWNTYWLQRFHTLLVNCHHLMCAVQVHQARASTSNFYHQLPFWTTASLGCMK